MSSKTYTGKDIERILILAQDVISLNTPVTNHGQDDKMISELGDFVEDTSPTLEEELIREDRRRIINNCLRDCLSPREREIIKLRFGLESGTPMTLEEVGMAFGNISRERIRQIEAKALRKLRIYFARRKIGKENL